MRAGQVARHPAGREFCAPRRPTRESPTWFTLTTPWPFLDPTYRHRVCEADGIQPVTEVSLNDQHHLIWGDVCVSCAYPVARGLSWGEPGIGMSNSVVKAQEVITPATPAHLSTNGTKRSMRKAFLAARPLICQARTKMSLGWHPPPLMVSHVKPVVASEYSATSGTRARGGWTDS